MYRLFVLLFVLSSCGGDSSVQPKPLGYLGLDYGKPEYITSGVKDTYEFMMNKQAVFQNLENGWAKINYPKLRASIDITYRPVDGNLRGLMMESEKLTFSHAVKADEISAQPYEDFERGNYGKIYEVKGNAATNIQFNITDSTANFLTASLYFKVTPNFDSIEPAVKYIESDIKVLMESLRWSQ